ncbi:Epithelial chloride channel proteinlike, partial [Caligus rogercresseyi]
PDVLINDGIYSRYLTDFSAGGGRYTITIFVDDNGGRAFSFQREHNPKVYYCCSRKEKEENILNMKLGTFSRIIKGSSFRIPYILDNGGGDILPPSRILDLKVEVLPESQELEFSWTAPGDDYDSGKVTSYRLHSCQMAEELYIHLNRTRVIDGFTANQEAGSTETHRIKVEELDTTLYYALVAIDDSGNTGSVSNIKKAYLASPAAVLGVNEIISPIERDSSSSRIAGGRESLRHSFRVQPDKALLYIVIGIAGFILICIILILIIVFSYRRKKIVSERAGSLSSVVMAGETMRSMGVSTSGRSEESTHSPGYSVVCDEQDLMRCSDSAAGGGECKGFLESSAVVINSSSSTQFSNGKYENQLAPRESTYGCYGWSDVHNPYVSSYREYQMPTLQPTKTTSPCTPSLYLRTFGLPQSSGSNHSSSSTNQTLLLTSPNQQPANNTPSSKSNEEVITRGMTVVQSAGHRETKSILKKPKPVAPIASATATYSPSSQEEDSNIGGRNNGGSTSSSSSSTSSSSSSSCSKDQVERSSQSSQVSFSDQEASKELVEDRPPSPSDNIYLETSFEYQKEQKEQEGGPLLNPPSLSAANSYINMTIPLLPTTATSPLGSLTTQSTSLQMSTEGSSSETPENCNTIDKRIRNITQV